MPQRTATLGNDGASIEPDVRGLADLACVVRAGVVVAGGKIEFGPALNLKKECEMARRWALWPRDNLRVDLDLPAGQEALEVVLEAVDPTGSLTASHRHHQPQGQHARSPSTAC